jgi:hypothetical protein
MVSHAVSFFVSPNRSPIMPESKPVSAKITVVVKVQVECDTQIVAICQDLTFENGSLVLVSDRPYAVRAGEIVTRLGD